MKIAISGADGFLGSHILDRLQFLSGVEVVAITRQPTLIATRYAKWGTLKHIRADVNNILQSDELDNVDVYVACAFPRSVGSTGMAEGLDFVYESLYAMLTKGCKSVINISSQSVYNPERLIPAKEGDQIFLTSEYAVAKYCVELSVAHMCRDKEVAYTNVRMSSLIGPGFDQRFVNKMVKTALKKGVIEIHDSVSRFSFLDVVDAADGLVQLVQTASSRWEPVFNLGTQKEYSIIEIGKTIARIVAIESGLRQRIVMKDGSGTRLNSTLNVALFKERIGWTSQLSIEESVSRITQQMLASQ